MKHLKFFESFKDYSNNQWIPIICEKYGIKNYIINSDGSIDVNGDVNLYGIRLTKIPLKFRNVSGGFNCANNSLTSFEGCPISIGGHFYCNYNQIDSFEGFPKHIGGGFIFEGSPINNVWKLFKDSSKIEFFNDCDIIRDGKVIILDRLNLFLEEIGKKPVKSVEGYKCI